MAAAKSRRQVGFKRFKVFTGTANRPLAEEICACLGCELGVADVKTFSDSEIYVQVKENVRGADVFVVQPTSTPVERHLFELLLMIDALKRASADRITAVLPYYGYARQDRKDKPRVPISAKLIASLLERAGANRILALDAGGVERARAFAKRLNAPLAIIDKRREAMNVAEVMNIIGRVKNRNCLIVDDLIDTAGTLVKGAKALLNQGATSVRACATHAVLSGSAVKCIAGSGLKEVVFTNSIPLREEALRSEHIRSLSVAPLLARAIQSIHEETSVSTLFV